jgi:colanic acid/amylovoran biosynthesis glycosyltransferase
MRPERIRYRATLPTLAAQLEDIGVQWVHAHFGWEAAGVAEALGGILRTGWSFTLHANDIFVANQHLAGKLARAEHVVTVCQYNADHHRRTYADPPPVDIVVCGVELPDPPAGHPADLDVLAVGRLVPKKGFDLLVRAAAELLPALPRLRIDIVGDGPERERLASLIREHGLEGVVRLVGPLDHAEVLERMAAAAVVCLPARVASDGDRDSMPVVLKEAMARAVPVVATAVVAIPEMVDDHVGRLVPPEEPGLLAAALHEVLADPALRARLGEAGRARVGERFTLEGEVGRLRDCFERWVKVTGR